MSVVRVTRNYQITIPADVRKRAGIEEGDLVEVVYDDGEGVIKIRKVDPLEEVARLLEQLPRRRMDWGRMKAEYYESRG